MLRNWILTIYSGGKKLSNEYFFLNFRDNPEGIFLFWKKVKWCTLTLRIILLLFGHAKLLKRFGKKCRIENEPMWYGLEREMSIKTHLNPNWTKFLAASTHSLNGVDFCKILCHRNGDDPADFIQTSLVFDEFRIQLSPLLCSHNFWRKVLEWLF